MQWRLYYFRNCFSSPLDAELLVQVGRRSEAVYTWHDTHPWYAGWRKRNYNLTWAKILKLSVIIRPKTVVSVLSIFLYSRLCPMWKYKKIVKGAIKFRLRKIEFRAAVPKSHAVQCRPIATLLNLHRRIQSFNHPWWYALHWRCCYFVCA